MNPMINETAIDYPPLTEPLDRAAVKAFKAQSAAGAGASLSTIITVFVIGVIVLIGGSLVFFTFIPLAFALLPTSSNGSVGLLVAAALALCVIGLVVFLLIRHATGPSGQWGRWCRLSRFAQANGFLAFTQSPDPQYPGAIFRVGSGRKSYDRGQSSAGRFIDISNYRYTTGSGKSRQTHSWGFMAMRLDRRLPHMVLDARSNNGLFGGTNLPSQFSKDQILILEGDFSEYFTLYCPREYERDALYVFTPDLMALLIDQTSTFDVEIVDDWMFVYSAQPLPALNPMMWQRMFRIVNTVGAKTLDQTERYRDERMVPAGAAALAGAAATANLIAPQGQRLRKGISWIAIVIGVGVAVVWLWMNFGLRALGN